MNSSIVTGKARDMTTFAPAHTEGTIVQGNIAKDSGALIVQGADLEASKDEVGTVPVQLSTSSITATAGSVTTVSVLSANPSRKGLHFSNTSTDICYVKFGTTASATSHTVQLAAAEHKELQGSVWTGAIDAIFAAATGNLVVTELS